MADIVYPGLTPSGDLGASALPANYDLSIYQGDYVEIFVTLRDSLGAIIDPTGMTGKAQIKTNYAAGTATDFTVTIVGTQFRIFLSSATSTTLAAGTYIWDFQVTSTVGTRTYLAGDVTVIAQVTT